MPRLTRPPSCSPGLRRRRRPPQSAAAAAPQKPHCPRPARILGRLAVPARRRRRRRPPARRDRRRRRAGTRPWGPGRRSRPARAAGQGRGVTAPRARYNQSCTGLARIARLGPTLWLKIPIRALKLAQNLGQPCAIFVYGRATGARARPRGAAGGRAHRPGGRTRSRARRTPA